MFLSALLLVILFVIKHPLLVDYSQEVIDVDDPIYCPLKCNRVI